MPKQDIEAVAKSLTIENIGDFLDQIQLGEHIELFKNNGVDGPILSVLEPEDLKDMGIANGFHRKKIIQKFRSFLNDLSSSN